jgi:hypothetical protein
MPGLSPQTPKISDGSQALASRVRNQLFVEPAGRAATAAWAQLLDHDHVYR